MNILNKIKENLFLFQKGEKNYIPHPKELGHFTKWFAGRLPGDVTCITGGTSSAKCLAKGTKVWLYNGKLKNVEDIVVGDVLLGPDSKPRHVTSINSGIEELYTVYQENGINYTVNKSHILHLTHTSLKTSRKNRRDRKFTNISVEDYLNKSAKYKHCYKGIKTGVEFAEQSLIIDPYFLGLWLGDGTSSNQNITNIDKEILEYLENFTNDNNLNLSAIDITYSLIQKTKNTIIYNNTSYEFSSRKEVINFLKEKNALQENMFDESGKIFPKIDYILKTNFQYNRTNTSKIDIKKCLKDLNLLNNKHIPHCFFYNSKSNRKKLLAGLIDSDGYYSKGSDYYCIVQKNKKLSDDIVRLCRSLGYKCTIKEYTAICNKCKQDSYPCYRIYIKLPDDETLPVKIERKKRVKLKSRTNPLICGIKVKFSKIEEYYGFTLMEEDGLFLLEDFTITHNTSLTKMFVFKAIEWAIENNKDYHVLWFGLEESEEQFEYSLLSFLIYQKSKGEVRYNIEHFEGLGKSIEEKHLKSIENIMPLFEKYKSYITFYETVSNSWGIYKEIRKFARQRGVFLKDNVPFTEEDFANSLQWNGYKKKNPNELVEVVIDHISELIPQKDQKDLAAAMIDLIKHLRMYVAKVFKYSVIVVQQQMFEMENLDHIKEEQVYASLQGLGDSKVIGRAYLNVIGITNVNRYGIRIAKTDTGDININQFQDYQRVIGILKRRYGVVNKKIGLYFDGCSGWFEEIPKDQDKKNEMINKIKKLTEQI